MGYQVLARKYRPQRFADVAGQDHVTRTLLNALEQKRIAHGYIFSGHRGIGKTTIARILAQALNCRNEIGSAERPTAEPCGVCDSCVEVRQGNAVDVIEIDAATNRGIDEIRELRDAARYSPARDKYKIYILDEAHQITEAAFNALLKTLEEPPAHVVFMMATTEPENFPQTIRSRCQHFSFHAVKFEDILAQLKMIAAKESVEAEDAALALLAEAGDGSMRDALSIMDQAIASAPCDAQGRPVLAAGQIRDLMGSVPNTVFERLMEAVAAGQSAELMEQVNVLLNAGHSPLSLARQLVRYLRNALMAKLGGEQTELLQISADERARAARTAMLFGEEDLTRNLQIVLRTFDDLNFRQEQRFHLELGLLKLVHAQRLLPLEELLSGVAAGGTARVGAPVARPAQGTPRTSSNTAQATRPAVSAAGGSGSPIEGGSGGWGAGSGGGMSASADEARPTRTPMAAASEPVRSALSDSGSSPAIVARVSEPLRVESPEPGRTAAVAVAEAPEAGALQQGVIAALANGGHQSAAQLLGTGSWVVDGSNLRIEVPGMGKKMLSLTVNAAAEKIIRQELQRLGGPARLMVVPGEGNGAAAAATAPPIAGSVQEEALKHPLVERAREIFKAEVRSVVDLRKSG
ncbi:MAG TPA: DNA polymerase III subunit gamma/tau [Terracidiphilus sp.]|nr:DNA polymerase III subunit gamma/tau [Terracidiphilus sp.]